MWSSRALRTLAVAAVLTGCGFRPLYAPAPASDVLADFSSVEIALIPDRSGQELRNELRDLLTPRGRPANPRYRLSVQVSESIRKLAVERTGLPTRADLQVAATYTLSEAETGKDVLTHSSFAISSYNLLASDYSTLIAERYARSRALEQIANDIRNRLAVYFSAQREAAAGAAG